MVDVTTTPCWYILHTYAGYESMVKDNLERLIENNNLQGMIFDVKIPMETTIEEKNGKRKIVERKLLPCYVFIKMIYSNQLWYWITNTRGVTGFVGPQGRPIPLKEGEIRKMRLEDVAVNAEEIRTSKWNIYKSVKLRNKKLTTWEDTLNLFMAYPL